MISIYHLYISTKFIRNTEEYNLRVKTILHISTVKIESNEIEFRRLKSPYLESLATATFLKFKIQKATALFSVSHTI